MIATLFVVGVVLLIIAGVLKGRVGRKGKEIYFRREPFLWMREVDRDDE